MSDTSPARSKWQRRLPLIASVLAITIGLMLIAGPALFSSLPAAPKPALESGLQSGLPKEGQPIPDFELSTLEEDRTVRLSDLRGSPVVINFWATWCGPCKQEMPLLVEQYNWNKGKGLRVLAIDTLRNDNRDDMRAFVAKYNMNFDVLVDETDAIAGGWEVMGLPTTFFVKPDGTVAKVHVGQLTADQLKEYMRLIMPN
jgi:peroxiredoxin